MKQEKHENLDDACVVNETLMIHWRISGWIALQGRMKVLSVCAEYDLLYGKMHN